MSKKKKKKLKLKKRPIIVILLIIVGIIIIKPTWNGGNSNSNKNYIISENPSVDLYDSEYNKVSTIPRGSIVDVYKIKEKHGDNTYVKIKYKDETYFIDSENLTTDKDNLIREKEMYVRTNLTLYKDGTSPKILSYIKKGEKVDILGYDKINSNGVVNKYKIKYNDKEGYVYGKYLVNTKEDSMLVYDKNGLQEYLAKMGNTLGGGTANKLDYYPYEKANFKDNKMPDEVRALYITRTAVKNIDTYIDFALNNNINALVIDIKDNESPAYKSPVMQEYSPTNYSHATNSFDEYKSYVKKAKDAGLYVIGRITTFKDSYYIQDHKDAAIKSKNGEPFSHNGSYWPTAYNRDVWEFNVSLGIEAVKEIGFNEIQFDYVRFPDRTINLEKDGTINLNNIYGEDKAQAIQSFVMYACDEIHAAGAYVSIDVFGESASDYVTAYGQFWPAISNVADVISGMPYPDHFNAHEYGIKEVVWTVPYQVLSKWGEYVVKKQEVIPTPAKVRTWIQAYNSTKTPNVVYDESKVSDEIQALYDKGLTGGYMTWNSRSDIDKYKEISYAFKKVYK